MGAIGETLLNFWESTGIANFGYQNGIMIVVALFFLYLAIKHGFEPLLLVPIAFGMLLSNLPMTGIFLNDIVHEGITNSNELADAGIFSIFYMLKPVLPSLIFLGVGAMTDFGPLIANPKSLLMGAAAQLGIFFAFFAAIALGFNAQEAGSIGIIGGADGPTAIYLTTKLADHLVGPIAVAAYSYMALVPIIQPPIMKALTTEQERQIKMSQLRTVSQREKILFPIAVTVVIALLLPSVAPLIGMLMMGNLFKESGRTARLSDTSSNALSNILVILLGTCVGASATGTTFLTWATIKIVILGVLAFCFGTAGGVLIAKLMNVLSKTPINPLIGSAGVSAVPMAARVSQVEGQKANPTNFLLMHAMGPNVAGVIGSGVAAGVMLCMYGGY
ncbi:MAG: sodium ion-translocating decarboxylase subunit beta [Firmicutes bacterium]|nr:sodium ion-translocating decarboxylase subunit beta [Clostridiales bacterium]MDD6764451.1 sodium ion-translocating decarboxylase subunit beta [Bacillota bacterium]MDD6979681.1 sodium ion-translocating decarboxylase subunit beta [Bacillota bacterium]MDD7130353.1 sodium ion-translocating decarboxylase subunit beta [Bacillota bacterium]MDY6174652.1 sodium ion-translocating decarboxylase subunit beta [Lentihominibacter sp.]